MKGKGKFLGVLICLIVIGVLVMNYYNPNNQPTEETNQQVDEIAEDQNEKKEIKDLTHLKDFQPRSVENGSKATYDLNLKMNNDGVFTVTSKILVENVSKESWDEVIFYFIPNAFTKENAKHTYEGFVPGKVNVKNIKINGKAHSYELQYDTLSISLDQPLKPNERLEFEMEYGFILPKKGFRFTKQDENYYLAQWYPMLATYQKGGWNKEDYHPWGESYHTDHSNFKVSYEIPEGYTFISSAQYDPKPKDTKGSVTAENVKEVFVGLIKDFDIVEKNVRGVNLRVIGPQDKQKELSHYLSYAGFVFNFYSRNIGRYPHMQLDIILDHGAMEYPGIVTTYNLTQPNGEPTFLGAMEQVIAHEMAHQWFYGVVTNDPYDETWIDEGLTTFATSLFFYDAANRGINGFSRSMQLYYSKPVERPSNLPSTEYNQKYRSTYHYHQPSLKLWELNKQYGGIEQALRFVRTYYKTYAYKEVTTEEFVRFTKAYYKLENDQFFEEWLKLN